MKSPTSAILAVLGGLQAVVAQQIGNGGAVWVDPTTCNPWAKSLGFPAAAGPGGLFTTALDILSKIADVGLYRLYNPTQPSQTSLPANVLAWERYRLNSTYGTFFGNNTDTKPFVVGIYDVANALWGVQEQWGPASDSDPYILVVCDDVPYLSKNSSDGKPLYTDPYRHSAVELPGDIGLSEGITTPCATNGQSSYAVYNTDIWSQNVILCTKNMKLPLGFTSSGPTTFASGTTLDSAGRSWLGALYTQALWSYGVIFATPAAHGFEQAHALSLTRNSMWNADCHKFFAFSLMLDGLFWGSGIGYTSHQEYANLQKTTAGQAIIKAFGLTNITVPARGIEWTSGWTPFYMGWWPADQPAMPPIPTS